jgi:hypothetical protein
VDCQSSASEKQGTSRLSPERPNADLAVLQIAYAYEQATDWVRAHLPPLLRA